MIEEFKYFILGLIQGLAEFFPISSSGHIVLFSSVLGVIEEHPLLLSITVHFATTLSTIIIYQKKIKSLFWGVVKARNQQDVNYLLKLLLSAIPIVFLGLFFRDDVNRSFDNTTLASCMLIFTGFFLILSTFFKSEKNEITFINAFIIGLGQAVAILPGISRSGLTITTALFLKIKRKDAAAFSFLMALFPIAGITVVELSVFFHKYNLISYEDIKVLLIAFFSAFISGLFACKYMIQIVQNNSLRYFGYYCIIIGLIFILFQIIEL